MGFGLSGSQIALMLIKVNGGGGVFHLIIWQSRSQLKNPLFSFISLFHSIYTSFFYEGLLFAPFLFLSRDGSAPLFSLCRKYLSCLLFVMAEGRSRARFTNKFFN